MYGAMTDSAGNEGLLVLQAVHAWRYTKKFRMQMFWQQN